MKGNVKNNRSAFTLVEIMITVAIIGLLAMIALPGYIRSRQLSQGRALLNDANQISAAIDQWAVDTGQVTGATVNSGSVSLYLKAGKLQSKVAKLKSKGGNIKDVLTTNTISIGNVGSQQVQIISSAKKALPAVTDWGNF